MTPPPLPPEVVETAAEFDGNGRMKFYLATEAGNSPPHRSANGSRRPDARGISPSIDGLKFDHNPDLFRTFVRYMKNELRTSRGVLL